MFKKIIYKIFDKTFKASNGIYDKNIFHESDKIDMVNRNCSAIIKDLNANHLLITKPLHSTMIIDADCINEFSEPLKADASITTKTKLILSVQSADCVPVLLGDNTQHIIAAAHCGRRSAKENLLEFVLKSMKNKGAKSIFAVIDPAIHQINYEVDDSFYFEIIQTENKAKGLFNPALNKGKSLFDLPGFIKLKLYALGIKHIIDYCENTYADPNKYYSYRRDLALGISGNKTNILSTIMIQG